MIHKASTIGIGNSDDFQHASDFLDTVDKSIVTAYMDKTGMAQEDLLQMMKDETWLSASDAKEKGFVDEIMFSEQAKAVASATGALPQNVIDTMRQQKQQPQSVTIEDIKSVVAEMKEEILSEIKEKTKRKQNIKINRISNKKLINYEQLFSLIVGGKSMKLSFKTYEEAKNNFNEVSRDADATAEQKSQALNDMMDALQKETKESVLKEAQTMSNDNSVLSARGQNVLTSSERAFFNEVIDKGGFDDESILPVETQERVFEDLKQAHPLLDVIGVQDLGAVTRYIYSDAEKNYAWGDLFGPIAGQIAASFREEEVSQLKLTAFAVIPNDMLELGPEWVERYVRDVAVETISVG